MSETDHPLYQQDRPEPGMDQGTDHPAHVRRGIVHPAPGRRDIVLRDTAHRTTATCPVTELATGDGMPVITGDGTTTLTTGGSGQPLRQ